MVFFGWDSLFYLDVPCCVPHSSKMHKFIEEDLVYVHPKGFSSS